MTDLTPNVFLKNGAVFANSRDVAAYFGKQHRNVLASIKEICSSPHSAENSAQWFQEVSAETKVGFGTRSDIAYDMTRDGFTLLVMGFTGQKAMQFKIAYIKAFNTMEAEVKPLSLNNQSGSHIHFDNDSQKENFLKDFARTAKNLNEAHEELIDFRKSKQCLDTIIRILSNHTMTDEEVAVIADCHPTYVAHVRAVHLPV